MDARHFDALTRRLTTRFSRRRSVGLLTMLGLHGLVSPDLAAAKKKKRKKKKPCPPCKRRKKGKCKGTLPDGTPCPDGTCQDGACRPPEDPCPGQKLCDGECIPSDQCCNRDDCPPISNYRCCNGVCTDEKGDPGLSCDQDSDCCSDYCRKIDGSIRTCAATCRGKGCGAQGRCCRGLSCESASCGGCKESSIVCEGDADCCFSACTGSAGFSSKQCYSYAGGPCEKDFDCRSCGIHGDCRRTVNGIPRPVCQDGICRCPYACCSDFECNLNQFCQVDDYGLRGECKPLVVGP